MANDQVCTWCHSADAANLEILNCDGERRAVHSVHRPELESYCHQTATGKGRFLGAIGASILLCGAGVVLLILSWEVYGILTAGLGVAVVSVTLLRYPFATPETVAWIGVRRSITLVRSMAYVVLAMAIGVVAYGLSR